MATRTIGQVPRSLIGLVERHGGSAVANARAAAATIGSAVAERSELTRLLLLPDTTPVVLEAGDLTVMDVEECLRLLAENTFGRLAYIARRGVPDIVPVNYILDGADILIRSGAGPKLQAAERGDLVAFEVDQVDDLGQLGWSVVVHGSATKISWGERQHLASRQPWANGPRGQVIRIHARRISGRRLHGA